MKHFKKLAFKVEEGDFISAFVVSKGDRSERDRHCLVFSEMDVF